MTTEVLNRVESDDGSEVILVFVCPGCGYGHHIRIKGTGNQPVWQWNGDMVKPTVSPSLLVNQHRPEKRCHSFIRNGEIQFLGDCFHDLKNQTVPLQPVEE